MTPAFTGLLLTIAPFAGIGVGLLATVLFELWTGRYDEAPEPVRRANAFARPHRPQEAAPPIDRRR